MDVETIDDQFSLRMSQCLYEDLHRHLFPGDGDEHGAVIEAGLAVLNRRRILFGEAPVEGAGWRGLGPWDTRLQDAPGTVRDHRRRYA